jgi:hypothetical protein
MPVTGAVGSAVAGAAGSLVSGIAGVGISAVFGAAGQWVASGAVWLLGQVGGAMSSSTTVDLSSGWFSAHEAVMAAMAAALVLPMVCCAVLQALYRQSASMLVRTCLVQLPLALLLTGVAVELVQMALAVTDTLSKDVLASAGVDATNILLPVSSFLIGQGPASQVPAFVVFVGGLLAALAALGLWIELAVRAAAVSVAVLFLPLALAAMVWPAIAHWCRRLADTLVALILSKLVIAAVLALAVGALAGGLGAETGPTGAGGGGGFAAVVTGIALLLIATLSPFTLLRLIPAVEAGAASHLESARHRFHSAAKAPLTAGNLALDIAGDAKRAGGSGGAAGASLLVAAGGAIVGGVAGGAAGGGAGGGAGGATADGGATAAGGAEGAGTALSTIPDLQTTAPSSETGWAEAVCRASVAGTAPAAPAAPAPGEDGVEPSGDDRSGG